MMVRVDEVGYRFKWYNASSRCLSVGREWDGWMKFFQVSLVLEKRCWGKS